MCSGGTARELTQPTGDGAGFGGVSSFLRLGPRAAAETLLLFSTLGLCLAASKDQEHSQMRPRALSDHLDHRDLPELRTRGWDG